MRWTQAAMDVATLPLCFDMNVLFGLGQICNSVDKEHICTRKIGQLLLPINHYCQKEDDDHSATHEH